MMIETLKNLFSRRAKEPATIIALKVFDGDIELHEVKRIGTKFLVNRIGGPVLLNEDGSTLGSAIVKGWIPVQGKIPFDEVQS